jgi:archaemetzincin
MKREARGDTSRVRVEQCPKRHGSVFKSGAGVSLLIALPFLLPGLTAKFIAPNAARRSAALGSLDGVSAPMRRALDARGFQSVKTPGPSDWLANHDEHGQRMDEFLGWHPNLPDNRRNKIYLIPIGDIERSGGPPLKKLVEFSEAFFGLETLSLPALDLRKLSVTRRRDPLTNSEQMLTRDALALLKAQLPANAYALLGITMEDLYPAAEWNYVFGEASIKDRVGIYSFARYNPKRNHEEVADADRVILRRCCHILAHEAGHMFGITHCIWYQCVMNGSSHLTEFDGQPLHLCPVDLRKLQWSVGFDVVERYKRLLAFCKEAGFEEETGWLRSQLRAIEAK